MVWTEKPRGQRTQTSLLKPNTNICLFMGYHFTSIPLEPKPVCCAQVGWHNSILVKLGVTGLAHFYECNANTDDTRHSQL